jgi:hypothetical protein
MKKCKACREPFTPARPMQTVCGPSCALTLARSKAEKKAAAERRTDKRQTRAALEAIKGLPELHSEAQQAFNAYIRERDKGNPCICCGQPLALEALTGGGYDAGHYRSVGAASHLRYDERNVHAQRKYCNRRLAGNVVGYRLGLIAKIGLEAVESLEADNAPKKWTRDDVRKIRDDYRKKLREMR